MTQGIETIVVGGGQAGLATSYWLAQQGCEHVVIEQAEQVGNAWRNDRWDSFTLVTPNWTLLLPGLEYQGGDPGGFLPRNEIVAYLEQYAQQFKLPIRYHTRVLDIEQKPSGRGYRVQTEEELLEAANVVIATGLFQKPRIPAVSADLPAGVVQLHSSQYRSPQALPPGAVLVVGSAQSGCQIAEELYQAGRRVYLATGTAGRVPRRYRGRDCFDWLFLSGFLDRTPDKLESSRARFAGNPHLSGKNGGHALNLHQFARDGVVLLGHVRGAEEGKIALAPDLRDNLARADKLEAEVVKLIDGYIARNSLNVPEERLPQLRDGYSAPEIGELDLKASGIGTILWATGYRFDFGLVKLPILDADGFPVTRQGVTAYRGLYFAGLPWLDTQKSGLFLGVGEQAAAIVRHLKGQEP